MMKFFWRRFCPYLLILSVFCYNLLWSEGFVADTLVRITSGYARIQDLSVDDEVLVYDWLSQEGCFNGGILSETITHITSHEVATIIRLDVGDDVIEMAEDQLLFMPLQQRWIQACHIKADQYLLGASLDAVRINSVTLIKQATCVYTISLAHYHNYLVCPRNIVVHNFIAPGCVATFSAAAEGTGFLAAFLAANPLVAPVTIGVGAAGLTGYGLWKLISGLKKQKKGSSRENSGGLSNNGLNGPEKDHEKNKGQDFFKRLKLRSDKRARTNRFGTMYRDPNTGLWWSKDLAGHGGSSYKVFKETARGLEWLFDATVEGLEIAGKHKGPTGLFIPYKEMIF